MSHTVRKLGGWNGELLRRVFLHQNGMAAITALATLEASGALTQLRRGRLSVADLLHDSVNASAVAASVVAVAGAGWLTIRDDGDAGAEVSWSVPNDAAFALEIFLDAHRAIRERDRGGSWAEQSVVERLLGCAGVVSSAKAAIRRRTSVPDAVSELLVRLVEGLIAVPLLPRIVGGHSPDAVPPLLTALELGSSERSTKHRLPFFAPMYGLAGSYAEALIRLPEQVSAGERVTPLGITRRIDRAVNVRASAAAHRGYFNASNRLIGRLFDEGPVSAQPRAILDIGCGDGSWLRELFAFVRDRTARGLSLAQHPLLLLGVDMDAVALKISAANLADLPAICLLGDVGQPATVMQAVTAATGIDVDDILSVRAFVDHNRSLAHVEQGRSEEARLAHGVYATPEGAILHADQVQGDWASHYAAWRQVCGRHGLVVIEAHTLSVAAVKERLESGHALALQYYHALSGQSPISYEAFSDAVDVAGLQPRLSILYPESGPTTSISLLAS
ncbi:hypothetical protein ACIHFD_36100 [Nonomuraea sp. NPDC051941]|uniref:AprA-related methyltransferase n=1 Tax=Nonomuraea sp. NPDC051941 TaxID=3364373 RepID=UPI0037C748C4